MKLTDHQKKILAAMSLPAEQMPLNWRARRASGQNDFFARCQIGRVTHKCQSIRFKTMLVLRDAGLVEAESDEAVRLVEDEVCRCGCDRWRLTQAGRELVATWNVRIFSHYERRRP